jgi:hypothetical protein
MALKSVQDLLVFNLELLCLVIIFSGAFLLQTCTYVCMPAKGHGKQTGSSFPCVSMVETATAFWFLAGCEYPKCLRTVAHCKYPESGYVFAI